MPAISATSSGLSSANLKIRGFGLSAPFHYVFLCCWVSEDHYSVGVFFYVVFFLVLAEEHIVCVGVDDYYRGALLKEFFEQHTLCV